jgi:dihydrolipoamide dehydrogenase
MTASRDAAFDVLVIGGGPGGYVAAIRSAQLGLRTALVEREHLGGVCSNWGCIPTKALLHAAAMYRQMQHAHQLGITVQGLSFDFAALMQRSRAVAERMNKGVRHLLKKNKVSLHEGSGRLLGDQRVEVTDAAGVATVIRAIHIIIATGARAREIPALAADGARIWNYRHALAAPALPPSLLVVGAGAIGMEFASFFAALGSKVTVVEARERVLPAEDRDVSAFVRDAFERQGIAIRTNATVAGVETGEAGLVVTLGGAAAERLEVDRMLVAAGLSANTEGLGLDKTAVRVEAGHIVTDACCRTAEPGIYAIGDVAGGPWLAHKASHEGVLCVEHIAGLHRGGGLDRQRIPACTYCHPQVASFGMTEEQALAQGHAVRVGRFPFIGNGKATALGETEGFIKTVFARDSGELLGAHLVGPEVTELVHSFAIAKTLETTEEEMMQTVFPHPTLSEAIHESVLMALGRAIHI